MAGIHDYFAVSVSHSHIDRVREYIKNQDEHHKRISWEEEVELFMKNMDLSKLRAKALYFCVHHVRWTSA